MALRQTFAEEPQELFRRGGAYRDAIRGKKWLLLTKFRRLRRQHRRDLIGLLAMKRRRFKAYLFKQQFEHAWTYTTEKGMREFLGRWRALLNWSRLTPLIEFYDMLMRHVDGVVAWARYRLTNADGSGASKSSGTTNCRRMIPRGRPCGATPSWERASSSTMITSPRFPSKALRSGCASVFPDTTA